MRTPKPDSTAVAPPSGKSLGFMKRHFRRRSSLSSPHPTPVSVSPQAKAPVLPPSTRPSEPPQIQIEPYNGFSEPSSKGTDDSKLSHSASDRDELSPLAQITSNGTASTVDSAEVPRSNSRTGGVRFANDSRPPQSPTRHRRTSSAGQSGRRNSIYLRVEGLYSEGVDVGAGSKARKLSVALPEKLYVDECPLSEHFGVFARANKKDIGEGGAAVVRLMQSKTAGSSKDRVFAVKEFREWEPENEKAVEYERKIKSEYAIAKSCQNPNIVETFRLCRSEKKWFHVMEYCEVGDLNDVINQGYLSREDRNCMFKQLLRGIEYLHSRGIAHRDIKSENLLLAKDGCLKIADFGTAEVFSGMHPGMKNCRRPSLLTDRCEIRLCEPGLVGSRPYMAPEIIAHKHKYDPRAVDVWSSAVVYLSLCIGGTPWECASTDIKNYNIFCGTWDQWLAKYPDGEIKKGRELPAFVATKQFQMLEDVAVKTLVMGMLHPDPAKRWSAKAAVESKTVSEFPCCQQEGYSDDIKTRQRKASHNHAPPKSTKGTRSLKPH